ncbi:MAG: FAD-dependent oxidoreductase [Rhizobiales bacterium 65-9]|nr:NAD(P)/FAD-dependent oxidoreductase [Hyphomicrobiales bacterium]OJY35068.1 MAG: FAD-dependent oxidoreductase [Rhizobiales bacterium 65-9]
MASALVIGAGVVGLACAAALGRRGWDVVVAEKADAIGTGVSSRNSEVVHGGMYYPTGSLRARHCVAGRRMLYAFCAARGVPVRKFGKLIVATNEAEEKKIAAIVAQGSENGVEGLALISGAAARAMEPALQCVAAAWSPETGIVDSHAMMLALLGEIEDHGGMIAFETPVERIVRDGAQWRVAFGGAAGGDFSFDAVINSAGLGAQAVARAMADYPGERIPKQTLAKGNYFAFARRPVFSRLIYPAPVEGGLGTHVTLDLSGRMKFGPDVEWIDHEFYEVDPARARSFYASIRRYFPALPDGSLTPDYSGIRPKLSGPGEAARDFVIDGPAAHGLRGIAHLFGIESPGLTSSLSIAEDVAEMVGE